MKNKIDLSVIIVNYNTKEITLACLTSLYQFTSGIDYEVIVVDNASSDSSAEMLSKFESEHKNFKLIRSSANIGFGPANNLGAKEAKGEYLLFLNSDTLLIENCLPDCLAAIKNKKAVALSCYLLNRDLTIQPSGGFFPTLDRLLIWQFFLDDLPLVGDKFKSIHPHAPGFFFLNRLIGRQSLPRKQARVELRPDWITGAFMLVPQRIFKEVGGFDDKIFMYTEEMELCYRLKKSGGDIILDPKSAIVHIGGASGGSHLALTKEVEGMLYFWQKHKPAWQLPLVKLIFFAGSLLRYVIFGIIKANATARQAYGQILRLLA